MPKATKKPARRTTARPNASARSAAAKPRRAPTKWVYLLSEGNAGMKTLLGGKGANLAEMVRLGLPVPPGFIVTTVACNAYLTSNSVPDGMWEQVRRALAKVESAAGKRFGDPRQPLLISCRSGAKFSMPGMMDTVLNIGLNDEVVEGLARLSGDRRFAFDAYRRLVQMFATVVLGLPGEPFEAELAKYRARRKVANDADLSADDLAAISHAFKALVQTHSGHPFPDDPWQQLALAVEAVFRSWNGKRAIDYRNAAGIAHDLGTAVNIQTMVFGNMGSESATGVVTTRNVTTGEPAIEGDWLMNAQGEDVVAGTRATQPIASLADALPRNWREFTRACAKLERHARDVQDVEFTIERGKLWMLQTRDAKRTAQAAVRIAVDLANERRITREEAVQRVTPEQVDYFLHPQFPMAVRRAAQARGELIASGLNVSPGAASGVLAFDADTAERWSLEDKKAVIMVRPETKPDDVHGMLAARGILTSRGGRTSHAALVARQFGKPAVVGVTTMEVDPVARQLAVGKRVLREGDAVSIDGTTGDVFAGLLETVVPEFDDPALIKLLGWADRFRRLGVWANADYPVDAKRARRYGAEGIGLARTEHMFFQTERLPIVQRMILAKDDAERDECLALLLPMQREDFAGLFRAMGGAPVTIRLIDPPLHEFLPSHDDLLRDVTEMETRQQMAGAELATGADPLGLAGTLKQKRRLLTAVESMRETNPMLGLRGVRLGIHLPALVRMQVRAIIEAACLVQREGVKVKPKIMIPLTTHNNELKFAHPILDAEARAVMRELGQRIRYQVGTMIEIPRAALTAGDIAKQAQFFSFGTNDLTQTTFGISRDDAETGFLQEYLAKGILPDNPFATLDQEGVGKLMQIGVALGRQTRPTLEVGICGEHGGDPRSIDFCHRIGLDYVSCSPFRVPVARLAAAHAALQEAAK
ncbi:MAG: pyruvate, phosphate dikinase [Burkholderiales bacterium]|nr:pyruvate, phosphate dikinase [Burkholderiales bacterium]